MAEYAWLVEEVRKNAGNIDKNSRWIAIDRAITKRSRWSFFGEMELQEAMDILGIPAEKQPYYVGLCADKNQ